MASVLSIMPPSTDCSAATSCGGSNSPASESIDDAILVSGTTDTANLLSGPRAGFGTAPARGFTCDLGPRAISQLALHPARPAAQASPSSSSSPDGAASLWSPDPAAATTPGWQRGQRRVRPSAVSTTRSAGCASPSGSHSPHYGGTFGAEGADACASSSGHP